MAAIVHRPGVTVLPLLELALPRAGQARRTTLVDAARTAAWRAEGRSGGTLPLHRYRLPRHELRVAEGETERTRVVSLDARPVARVEACPARDGLAARALGLLRTRPADATLVVGDERAELSLLGIRRAGDDVRRLRIHLGSAVWSIAQSPGLPMSLAVWPGEVTGAPVAQLRSRAGLEWYDGARLADLVVLEAVSLAYGAAELEVLLRRFGVGETGGRLTVMSPLGPGRAPRR